tara:strand:- start:582 stop:824 length:243 start_codon:yes stop_codon:yes gene_type:complete
MNWIFKIIIAIIFDVADFFVGRIPVIGTGFDIAGTALGFWLWGGLGLAQGLEIIDFTDQIDAFIPTLTIIGIIRLFTDGH